MYVTCMNNVLGLRAFLPRAFVCLSLSSQWQTIKNTGRVNREQFTNIASENVVDLAHSLDFSVTLCEYVSVCLIQCASSVLWYFWCCYFPAVLLLESSSNCEKEKIIYNNYVIYVNTDRRQPSIAGDCLSAETFILILRKITTSLFRNCTLEGFLLCRRIWSAFMKRIFLV